MTAEGNPTERAHVDGSDCKFQQATQRIGRTLHKGLNWLYWNTGLYRTRLHQWATPERRRRWARAIYWDRGLYRLGLHQLARGTTAAPASAPTVSTPPPDPAICDSLHDWCAREPSAQYRGLAPPETIRRGRPNSLTLPLHPEFDQYYEVPLSERALVRLPAVRMLNLDGAAQLPNGQYIGELISRDLSVRRAVLSQPGVAEAKARTPVIEQRGEYYLLLAPNGSNYYHWNHDLLAKLAGVLDALPPDVRFVTPAGLAPQHRQSLAALGVSDSRLIEYDGRETWRLEAVHVALPFVTKLTDHPAYFQAYRERLLQAFGLPQGRPHRRLYISRRQTDHDRLINEAEIIKRLRYYAVEVVQPERLSLREQAALFAEAELIVGAGAGLFNMVFAPRGARVVELQQPQHFYCGYWTMAEALGHAYWYVLGGAVPNPASAIGRDDMWVSGADLRRTLRRAQGV